MSRFLLVRLGALGDIVHAIPVAAALRRAFPSSRIDWLVSAKHREILDLVPVIDRRLVVNDRSDSSGGTSLLTAVKELRRTRYDATIDMQGLIKSALIARSSGASRVVGFSARYLREPLARVLYTDVYDPGGGGMYATSETRHVVQINLGLLGPLGVKPAAPEFPIEPVESTAAREMRDRSHGRYALLNPGAAWPNTRWPAARCAELANRLSGVEDFPPSCCGGRASARSAKRSSPALEAQRFCRRRPRLPTSWPSREARP